VSHQSGSKSHLGQGQSISVGNSQRKVNKVVHAQS